MTDAAQKRAQRNRGTIFVEDGEVLSREALAGDQFVQRIRAPKTAAHAEAGSFVHVACDPMLPMRRPMSIMRAQEDWFEILYKTHGEGLTLLSEKGPGASVSVLGPIGVPFDPDPAKPNCLLIGGGVGIPPMVCLADAMRDDDGFEPLAILGSEIPFPFDLVPSRLPFDGVAGDVSWTMPLLESWGVPTRLTTKQGYQGCFDGFVTELADNWLGLQNPDTISATKIFACGPTPMLKAVAELAAGYGVDCEVSLEEYMACAVGGCAGCAVPIETPEGRAMKRVCVDGPVFDAATVVWS